jgi:hypothetical protein
MPKLTLGDTSNQQESGPSDKREALNSEVWAEPVNTVVKRYRVSDNGLGKRRNELEFRY